MRWVNAKGKQFIISPKKGVRLFNFFTHCVILIYWNYKGIIIPIYWNVKHFIPTFWNFIDKRQNIGYNRATMTIQKLIDIVGDISDETMRMAFGRSLKRLREHTNTTQKALATATSVPSQSISVYERGETAPTITQAIRITNYFGLTIDDFILFGLDIKGIDVDDEFKNIIHKYEYGQF